MGIYFDSNKEYDLNDHIERGNMEDLANFIKEGEDTIPSYILSGESPYHDPKQIGDDGFALVIKEGAESFRRFPVHSKADTWMTQQAFIKTCHSLPISCVGRTAHVIKSACEFFDIEINDFVKRASGKAIKFENASLNTIDFNDHDVCFLEDKLASDMQMEFHYALPSEERYPLNTQKEIKMACEYFQKHAEELGSLGEAEEFAENVKLACIKFNVDIPEAIYECTDDYNPINLEVIKKAVDDRIYVANRMWDSKRVANIKLAYDNIIENAPFLKPSEVIHKMEEVDSGMMKIAKYNHFQKPSDIIKISSIFEGKDISVNETHVSPNFDSTMIEGEESVINSGNHVLNDEEYEALETAFSMNPKSLHGFISDETIEGLMVNFRETYEMLPIDDKLTIKQVLTTHME